MSDENDQQESKKQLGILYDLFVKHFVAIVLRVSESDTSGQLSIPGRIPFPGITLICRGRSFYLTAGHNLAFVEKRIAEHSMRVDSASLVDIFGQEIKSKIPIPLDFMELPRYPVVDEHLGLDIGLIELTPYYVRHLEQNNVLPLKEDQWAYHDLSIYDGFFLLGFPDALHGSAFAHGQKPILEPTLIPVRLIQNPPEDVVNGRPNFLFFGELPENLPFKSVEGTSGGPIFGVKTIFHGEGTTQTMQIGYQIVAMQFGQWENKRIIVGCKMSFIGDLLTQWIENAYGQ